MTSPNDDLDDLRGRLQVLEEENDLLSERAEDIAMLGLVAEQTGRLADPLVLVTSVLERVCILKSFFYGAWLERVGAGLQARAVYHLRRTETGSRDLFQLDDPAAWPIDRPVVLGPEGLGQLFGPVASLGPDLAASALALVPMAGDERPECCLLFLDERRGPKDLAGLLPLLERVADLTRARLDNLGLLAKLRALNLNLDRMVADRTESLRQSEARYRVLFDRVPDGVLLVDAEGGGRFGRIEDANEPAAAMHGYTLEELRRLDVEALQAPGPGPQVEAFEARIWRLGPGETVQEELLHLRKDGSTFPVEAIGTLVNLAGRQYVLAFARDITERRQAQEALLRTQRTESLGLLAGGIAHDFNNLLTAVMGQVSLAQGFVGGVTPASDHLQKALSAAGKAAELTMQMLAYSGRGKFSIQPVDLNRLIQENLRLLEAAIPKQVVFRLDLPGNLPAVIGDPNQLQQVVMNLVLNAVEAIGSGAGTIAIRTGSLRLDRIDPARWPLTGHSLAPGDFVQVEVADTGCGMTEQVRARIFDPFYTTKSKGHGLGLSAVLGVVRGHRGGLAVASEVGAGTRFTLLLPAGGPGPGAAAAQELSAPAVCPRRTVLVIDDEDYMLEVVADILAQRGHAALLARSGEQGLELLRLQSQGIDMVLLDLTMPGIGGVETLLRIRALAPGMPVVLCSGFAEEEATTRLAKGGFAGFLQKPYRAEDLYRWVEAGHRPKRQSP